jgi:hypothetical protein
MIVQTTELSPNQKAAIEEILGRRLLERDAVSVHTLSSPTATERLAAAEKLRTFLQAPDRPTPNCSEEEMEDAITEAMRTVRPSYRPFP